MLIYEKENRLNINFENSVNETPDIQIGKDGDKTQILVDGQSSGGSGSGNVLTLYLDAEASEAHNKLPELYKNIECTEGWPSVEEGNEALLNATFIRVMAVHNGSIVGILFPLSICPANNFTQRNLPAVSLFTMDEVPLHIENGESEEPEIPDPGGSR